MENKVNMRALSSFQHMAHSSLCRGHVAIKSFRALLSLLQLTLPLKLKWATLKKINFYDQELCRGAWSHKFKSLHVWSRTLAVAVGAKGSASNIYV